MYETKNRLRSALLLGAATFAAIGFSTAAIAADSDVETVVVTGSRIPSANLESSSPVAVVSSEVLQDTGTVSVESLLNTLPEFEPSLTSTSNNPSSGTAGGTIGEATIDLRGLGSNRALVLVNGRRVIASNGYGQVDINLIPAALVERVEVVTGGASAVYGSDAMSGVVNFILKKDYEGVIVNAQYGTSQRGDGQTYSASATMGVNSANNKGNIFFNLSYDQRSEVLQAARPWSYYALLVQDGFVGQSGSGTTAQTRYDPGSNAPSQAGVNALFATYGYSAGTVGRNALGFNFDGTNYDVYTGTNLHNDLEETAYSDLYGSVIYNYAPVNDLIIPFNRYNLFGSGTYQLYGDKLEAFAEFLFTQTQASNALAPTPVTGLYVPVTNPYIPTAFKTYILDTRASATADFIVRKRFVEAGSREEHGSKTVFQFLTGLRGNFEGPTGTPWSWEVSYSGGRVQSSSTQYGNLQYSKIEELLYASDGGASTCGDFDIFTGNIDADCISYIGATTHNTTTLESKQAMGTIAGNVYDLPAGPIGVAFGVEWRWDSIDYSPDAILASGDVVGFNANDALYGSKSVVEGFGEIKVPVLADLPFAKALNLEAGYRYSTYSNGVNSGTWKLGGDYAPFDFVRFRGMYQYAVRAPSLAELYSPQYINYPTYSDPCTTGSSYLTGTDGASVAALCATQFGTTTAAFLASGWHQNTQAQSLVGGNPDLTPETARTITLGTVLTPGDMLGPWLEPLTVSVDWYRISVADYISTMSASTIIARCFNSGGFNPTYDANNYYCTLFSRDGAGDPSDVSQTFLNLAGAQLSGFDFQVSYGLDLAALGAEDWGTMHFDVRGTYLQHWKFQSLPGEDYNEYKGTIYSDVGTANPQWKVNLMTNWDLPTAYGDVGIVWRARFIDEMDPLDNTYGDSIGTPRIIYHDVSVNWQAYEGVKIYAGINNLLDRQPPLYTGDAWSSAGVQANTDPSTFDVLGRYFFFGITYKN